MFNFTIAFECFLLAHFSSTANIKNKGAHLTPQCPQHPQHASRSSSYFPFPFLANHSAPAFTLLFLLPISHCCSNMEGLKTLLQQCEQETLVGVVENLCAMFQERYLNEMDGVQVLESEDVKAIVRSALFEIKLAKQRQ